MYVSQGSVVMQLRCGGIFNNYLIVNYPPNVLVKEFWKSVNIWQRYGQWRSGKFFLEHSVCSVLNPRISKLWWRDWDVWSDLKICSSLFCMKDLWQS